MTETDKLIMFYDEHERVPTYEEMKKLFGVKSKNTVAYKVKKLIEEGVLVKEGRRLAMGIVGGFMKLGNIQAGFPTTAEEQEEVSLDRMLMRRKGRTFLLEVQGESMKDAGIFDGDLVVVERGREPLKGDIVVARMADEYTLKYFNVERGKPVLIPANKKFKKIYPDPDNFQVEAVASAVVRRFR
jgi:SOS regulatory protein LexA